jgi:hypothetical protein
MRVIARLLPVLLLAPALAAEVPANIVDLHLSDGSRVTGPLLQETTSSYIVHQVVLTKKGMMASDRTFAKSDVTECVQVQAEYGRRDRAAGDDAAAQAGLAAWCLDEQLRDEADEHAHRALKKDGANAQAGTVLTALGYVDDHGAWMKADDYLAAHGLAQFDGKVMSVAERDSLAKLAAQRQADQVDAAAAQASADAIKRDIAHDQERTDAIAKEQAAIEQRLTQDQQATDAVGTSKKELDAANAKVSKEENRQVKHKNGSTGPAGTASPASLAAQRKAKEDYQAAQDAAGQAQTDQDAAKERQKTLATELAGVKSDLDAQQAKLPRATQDASDAATKARGSDQRYQEAFAAIVPPTDLPPQFSATPGR